MRKMSLPRPDGEYGHYLLGDGSCIYPSGIASCPGKWFVWLATGKDASGKPKDGNVAMDKSGIVYFDSPQQALDWINREGERVAG